MAAARLSTHSDSSSSTSPGPSGIDFPSGDHYYNEEDSSSFSDESGSSLFWDQNDTSLNAQSVTGQEAHVRSSRLPSTIDEANTTLSAQADPSRSRTSLSTVRSNVTAAEPVEGKLNVSARRGQVTRTFSLPPSTVSTLTYATLLHMLELDVPIRHSRWSTSSSRRSLRAPLALRSIFAAGGKLISSSPEIWISYSVAQAVPLGELPTARARSRKQWYKLQSFACIDADKFLFDALMVQLLREHIEQNRKQQREVLPG